MMDDKDTQIDMVIHNEVGEQLDISVGQAKIVMRDLIDAFGVDSLKIHDIEEVQHAGGKWTAPPTLICCYAHKCLHKVVDDDYQFCKKNFDKDCSYCIEPK